MASIMSRQALLRISVRAPHMIKRSSNRAAAATIPQKHGHGRAFSSTARTPAMGQQQQQVGRSGGMPSGEATEIPAFSLKQLSPSPRMRYAIVALLLTTGFLEGASWVYFWPKVSGSAEGEKEDK
ncbi:hypothetical protein GGTG_00319 [Gaeumannomyces tritici R3-111a-1]|uniref:Uncharacterized protein n=1 Tax=Gaeumannomyces tritici (strain R3-111a-1) TaxID=644352 RepID=J3NGC8_GAET3|nr:hypothetical protein GGTG_00319 [Gaeumannomyces tritici R3-111a-1]EJT80318.1 hypothetical protein GGTG_00319 [Gaeumannomyces tritici R3-111a-1]